MINFNNLFITLLAVIRVLLHGCGHYRQSSDIASDIVPIEEYNQQQFKYLALIAFYFELQLLVSTLMISDTQDSGL